MNEITLTEQLFFGLGIIGSCCGVLALALGLVYAFGGSEIRQQIKDEF